MCAAHQSQKAKECLLWFASPMSDSETVECRNGGGGRHEKSLGLLTAKFVDLLQSAEGGVLDLKKVL